jgi:MFS family permease
MSKPEQPQPPTRSLDDYRNVAAIVVSLMLMQTAVGALSVVGPFSLMANGRSSLDIGIVVTFYAIGFLVGARFAPSEIAQIGHIRAIAAFAAFASLAAAGLSINSNLIWWMVMEFTIGASVAGLAAAGEGWVADSAPPERRGSVLGFYLVLSKLGFMSGPFIASIAPPDGVAGFMIVAALFTACLLPVSATRRDQPPISSSTPFGPMRLWRTAPSAVIAALVAGLVNGAVIQLYAIYAETISPGDAIKTAALFNAAMAGGGALVQWPAGMVSDRIDRRLVIAGLALLSAVAAFALWFFADRISLPVTLALATVWGAGALSFYGIAIAHAADRAVPGQITGMMAGILMVWAVGSMIGPLAASSIMQVSGHPEMLFAFASGVLALLALAMTVRSAKSREVGMAEKSTFAPSSATSVSVMELNPMSDIDDLIDSSANKSSDV